jgi:hypothetical protein
MLSGRHRCVRRPSRTWGGSTLFSLDVNFTLLGGFPMKRHIGLLGTCQVLGIAIALIFGLNAMSQQTAAASDRSETPTTAHSAGQKVAVDPQTGKVRPPTPEESRRLGQSMKQLVNHSTEGLTVVQHANGMKSVNLQDRFQSAAVAHRNVDGTVAERCVTSTTEAQRFATAGKPITKRQSSKEEQ